MIAKGTLCLVVRGPFPWEPQHLWALGRCCTVTGSWMEFDGAYYYPTDLVPPEGMRWIGIHFLSLQPLTPPPPVPLPTKVEEPA